MIETFQQSIKPTSLPNYWPLNRTQKHIDKLLQNQKQVKLSRGYMQLTWFTKAAPNQLSDDVHRSVHGTKWGPSGRLAVGRWQVGPTGWGAFTQMGVTIDRGRRFRFLTTPVWSVVRPWLCPFVLCVHRPNEWMLTNDSVTRLLAVAVLLSRIKEQGFQYLTRILLFYSKVLRFYQAETIPILSIILISIVSRSFYLLLYDPTKS